jgi:hypothetical protein
VFGGFEVLRAVDVKRTVSWVVMSCISERYRCFGGNIATIHRVERISQARNRQKEVAGRGDIFLFN